MSQFPKICIIFFLAQHILSFEDYLSQWSSEEKNGIIYKVRLGVEYNLEKYSKPVLEAKSIRDVNNMEALIIRNTNIEEIEPKAFEDLPQLKRLHLIGNYKLRKIVGGVFNNLPITQLELTYGYLSNIAADAFDNMTNLEVVYMYSINLKTWESSWFANTPSLKEIIVNFNEITELPSNAFKNLNCNQTFKISFYHNKIKKIEDTAFANLKNIEMLTFANNEISNWNGKCLEKISVNKLVLRNNKLECLAKENFDLIFAANFTDIRGNLLKETCVSDIKQYAEKHNSKIIKT